MNLWIRSQDRRKLVKNPQLYCEGYNKEYFIEDVNDKYLKLGTYKTEERALEVLDEIQRIIEPRLKFQEIKTERKLDNKLGDYDLSDAVLHTYQSPVVKELGTYVYEMPEE